MALTRDEVISECSCKCGCIRQSAQGGADRLCLLCWHYLYNRGDDNHGEKPDWRQAYKGAVIGLDGTPTGGPRD